MNEMFQGIWPAMFTPVDEQGNPALGELEKLVECLIGEGVSGLYILGSTGQGILFNEKQRNEVASVVMNVARNRVPVMVQVGSLTTDESCRLARHAAQIGVQGISSVSPIYYAGGAEMVIEHYRAIAQISEVPFFPYQLGNHSIQGEVIDFVDKLLEMPQVQGMKLTTTDLLTISKIHNYAGDRLKLFSGADELLCHSALCGTVGAIGTFYNIWYKECEHVRNSFIGGDFALARDFMLEFQRIIFEVLPNAWTFFRAAMEYKHGIDIGSAVRPVGNVNQKWSVPDLERIMNELEEAASSAFNR